LACRPRLLIADEPTTALDVTTQAQIIELLQGLQERLGMAVMFITHDLGVVAEIADRVTVMYLGIVAEECAVDDLFHDPRHPYTRALLRSVPTVGPRAHRRLATIRGIVPHPYNRPPGCPFHARCDSFMPGKCDVIVPPVVENSERAVRCLLYDKPEDLRPAPQTRSA
jgi:peptide/nickel transport system ATP-binding protein